VADVDSGVIEAVVCWKLDRLCRSHADFQRLWAVMERRGARLVSLHEMFDSGTPSGEFVVRLLIGMAKMESDNISLRVKSYLDAAARGGRHHTGGSRAYGYTYQGEIVQAEADTLREAARRVIAGEPLRAVVNDLNARGLQGTNGTPLRITSVARALCSPRVAGLVERHGEIVGPGGWEPILDRGTWEQVKMALADPLRRVSPGPERKHLLPGFVVCGIEGCGHKLFARPFGTSTGRPGRAGQWRYICLQGDRAFGKLHLSIVGEQVDRLVTEHILDRLDHVGLAQVLATQAGAGDARTLGEELATLDARLIQLGDDYGDGTLDKPTYKRQRARIEDRARHARAQLAKLTARRDLAGLPPEPGALRGAWPGLTLAQRRVVVGLVVERVVILPADGRKGRRFDPERVVIPADAWKV
jgi:hypothetical protein